MVLSGCVSTNHNPEMSTFEVLVGKMRDCGQMHISAMRSQEGKTHKGRQNEISEPGMLVHHPVMSGYKMCKILRTALTCHEDSANIATILPSLMEEEIQPNNSVLLNSLTKYIHTCLQASLQNVAHTAGTSRTLPSRPVDFLSTFTLPGSSNKVRSFLI